MKTLSIDCLKWLETQPEEIQKIVKQEAKIDRWAEGRDHHPKSKALMSVLEALDLAIYGDSFCWRVGGDGDNGETLMYQLDAYFESEDAP